MYMPIGQWCLTTGGAKVAVYMVVWVAMDDQRMTYQMDTRWGQYRSGSYLLPLTVIHLRCTPIIFFVCDAFSSVRSSTF